MRWIANDLKKGSGIRLNDPGFELEGFFNQVKKLPECSGSFFLLQEFHTEEFCLPASDVLFYWTFINPII